MRSTSFTKKRLIIIGTLLIVGSTLFLMILEGVREHGDLARLDMPTLNWIVAHRNPFVTILMQIVTNIMAPVTLAIIVLAGASIWGWRKRQVWHPVLLVSSMGFALVVSTVIKNIVERGRPPIIDMIPPNEIDYSFPSGHTLGIAVCLLVIGYFVCVRKPTKQNIIMWSAITVVGVAIVAFSRLYLAYHWVTDVSASVGIALVILGLVIIVDTLKKSRVKAA